MKASALTSIAASMFVLAVTARAQNQLNPSDRARADVAVRAAFAFLYALPRDTAGAKMDSWVLDTSVTTPEGDKTGRWRILAAKLADTGRDLPLAEVLRDGGTSPAQLAASMAAVQRLEGRVSKAEAEAAIEVVVTINEAAPAVDGLSDQARRTHLTVAGARVATRIRGSWIRYDDRELEVTSERWSPATMIVEFAGRGLFHAVTVTAQGNEEMIDKLLRETKWEALAALTR